VLGLCGGYQMLGKLIHDPQGLEGPAGTASGLGHLDVETTLLPDKTLTSVSAIHVATGSKIKGYEIHVGKTNGPDCNRPFAMIGDVPDGAVTANNAVMGTYLHGCFSHDPFRKAFLKSLGAEASNLNYEHVIEQTLDDLAAHLEAHLDLDRILAIATLV